jgi:hypothetical protein
MGCRNLCDRLYSPTKVGGSYCADGKKYCRPLTSAFFTPNPLIIYFSIKMRMNTEISSTPDSILVRKLRSPHVCRDGS